MRATIALYKGPPHGLFRLAGHYAIRLWTWSRWSHGELVIHGVALSSSARDGGVRAKVIDLDSGRWDLIDVELSADEVDAALLWFYQHEDDGYDWLNIGRFVAPFIGHARNRWVCFEAIGAALRLAAPHKLTANDLCEWARLRAPKTEPQPGGV